MSWNFFAPKVVRTANDMCKHVRRILAAQRDLLSPQAVTSLETALADMQKGIASRADADSIKKLTSALETAATKWLKPYPNAGIRENVEVLLVALAVAMGIRTFFVQPFKIPTGSMQPTLYGVTPGFGPYAANQPELQTPGRIARFFDFWLHGNSYIDEVAPVDGHLEAINAPVRFALFNLKQEYQFANQWHTIWFPPDELFERAGQIANGRLNPRVFKAGEPIVRLKVTTGDHLFVDRMSYNFRAPGRGEIIVFETKGIPEDQRAQYRIPADQFYIKRLVALPNETVQVGGDRHLRIDGVRLDDKTPHFERVYGFNPNDGPAESHYSGHVNSTNNGIGADIPLFPNSDVKHVVSPDHYMVMGDNTMNSLDSRFWGDLNRTNVIGKYFFVYWPFNTRFGLSVR